MLDSVGEAEANPSGLSSLGASPPELPAWSGLKRSFADASTRRLNGSAARIKGTMKVGISDIEAIGLAVAGFTCWVLADSVIKLVGRSALPAYEVIGFLGLFVVACLTVYALLRGETKLLLPRQPRRQMVRSCLDLINNLCVVVALRHVPLTLFYILVFTSPTVITILAAVFLKERIELRKALAMIAGFAGVVIAVNPFTARVGDWIGLSACMTCVACFSVNMVWARVLTRTEPPESLTFSSGVVMVVAGLGFTLWHAEPLTSRLLAALFVMGLFCALGSICFFIALKHTSAANVSQYHYTQLVSGALIAYLGFHELPSLFMVLGGVLIVISGLYIAVVARQVPA
jgi:drug/metabolite transporter (DMT)-like permease